MLPFPTGIETQTSHPKHSTFTSILKPFAPLFTMLFNSALVAALAGVATAAPGLSQAKQVHLKLQAVTKDFNEGPVNGQYLVPFHTGAGTNVIGAIADVTHTPTFYNHGPSDAQISVSADLGTPPTPFGLDVPAYTRDGTAATLNAGPGKDGLSIRDGKLGGALWAICNRQVAPIGKQKVLYLFNVRGGQTEPLPEECVEVDILAECAGDGSTASPDARLTTCHMAYSCHAP